MGPGRTDGRCKEAVRLTLISGLTRKQVADDLGVRAIRGTSRKGQIQFTKMGSNCTKSGTSQQILLDVAYPVLDPRSSLKYHGSI